MPPGHLLPLVPHPSAPAPSGVVVSVALEVCPDDCWRLDYRICDPLALIRWPPAALPGPADGLWQHTCCEAFVAEPDSGTYTEFNFSPAGQWARYRFVAYRVRADQGQPTWRPMIECAQDGSETTVTVQIASPVSPARALQVGISCVIEALDGTLSYWALKHPAARPDFHHRDGFALMLGKE